MENKPKWYQSGLVTILLLIVFFPVGLYWMWKHPRWNKKIKWGITAFFLLLIFGVFNSPDKNNVQTAQPEANQNTQTESDTGATVAPNSREVSPILPTAEEPGYEIVERTENKAVENIKVLISSGDDGSKVAMEVKKTCQKPCNVDIYDNRQALELNSQYDSMMGTLDTKPEELQAWKEKNYVFVADHLVGYLSFDAELSYEEYPFKDWYYEELKSKN